MEPYNKPFKLTLEDSNGNKAFITIRAKDVDEAIQKVKVEYHPECTLKVSETLPS